MGFSVLFLFFLSSAFHINVSSSALIAADFRWSCSSTSGNFTPNSAYEANLNRLFSQLSSDQVYNHGFYNMSVGQSPDQVNAIALCRGDKSEDICRSCLTTTTDALNQTCPQNKEAIGWSEFCTLRYSNGQIYGVMETDPSGQLWRNDSSSRPTDADGFHWTLSFLLKNLSARAAAGGPDFKCATGMTDPPQRIYAIMQCTPDLSQQRCSDCLGNVVQWMRKNCSGFTGCRILLPSCNSRYEIDKFLDSVDVTVPPPTKGKRKTTAIIISMVALLLGILLLMLWIFLRKRKPEETIEADMRELLVADMREPLQYNFATVQEATNNFSEKLGQGAFGVVYKGNLNGRDIAVKELSSTSRQGEPEFRTEITVLVNLRHRNLVSLIGYSLEGNKRLLIYEYVKNGSLDGFISDSSKRAELDWGRRYQIIKGIADGLKYLHKDSPYHVIHRDLKASNILLDEHMNPKIADFGLAKLLGDEETHDIASGPAGTIGYKAPEYLDTHRYSVKSDAFSFGVLILEIVRGKLNSKEKEGHIIRPAWKNWEGKTPQNFVDSELKDSSDKMTEITKCINIGLLCVQEDPNQRPSTEEIVGMLTNLPETLPSPSPPPPVFLYTC